MSEETPTHPVAPVVPAPAPAPAALSPTGTPRVAPKLVPFFAAGLTLCGAIVAAGELGVELNHHVTSWAIVGGLFFAGMLGVSPGWRK